MRPLLAWVLAFSLLQAGCGGFVASGDFEDGHSRIVVVSGTVTSTSLSSVVVGGGFTRVTVVTLFNGSASQNLTFCGNALSQFPMSTSVRVDFNPGAGCNQIVVVVVG